MELEEPQTQAAPNKMTVFICLGKGVIWLGLCKMPNTGKLSHSNGFFFFFFSVCLFIYLAVLGLSCGMQDLQLQHAGSSVAACGIMFPDQGSNPAPLNWERGVLATAPPGKPKNIF